jgi:hypothetical protein
MLLDVVTHVIDGERPWDPEGPGKRSSPFGVREAIEIKVQPSAPTRQPAAGVRNKSSVRHHHAQQLGGRRPSAASNARTSWADVRCYRSPTFNH